MADKKYMDRIFERRFPGLQKVDDKFVNANNVLHHSINTIHFTPAFEKTAADRGGFESAFTVPARVYINDVEVRGVVDHRSFEHFIDSLVTKRWTPQLLDVYFEKFRKKGKHSIDVYYTENEQTIELQYDCSGFRHDTNGNTDYNTIEIWFWLDGKRKVYNLNMNIIDEFLNHISQHTVNKLQCELTAYRQEIQRRRIL